MSLKSAFLNVSFAAFAAATLTACGDSPELESLEPVTQDVAGGTTIKHRTGVVALGFGGSCTGVLLNRFTILTAAHCVAGRWRETFPMDLSAVYARPDGKRVCLTGGSVHTDAGKPLCDQRATFDVSVYPGFDGNDDERFAKDLAVLKSRSAFVGVTPSDYALVLAEPLEAPLVAPWEGEQVEHYGYGVGGNDGKGSGVLRGGLARVEHAADQYFFLLAEYAVSCRGDSGGPAALSSDESGPDLVVAGVLSVGTGESWCARSLTAWATLAPKLDFIREKSGETCSVFKHPKSGRQVAACFSGTLTMQAANGRLVQTLPDGTLQASADDIGSFSQFELISHAKNGKHTGVFSLVSLRNHRLVTAENAGSSPLAAHATQIGKWESFRFFGDGFTAEVNGKLVQAKDGGDGPLIARGNALGPWETFQFNLKR